MYTPPSAVAVVPAITTDAAIATTAHKDDGDNDDDNDDYEYYKLNVRARFTATSCQSRKYRLRQRLCTFVWPHKAVFSNRLFYNGRHSPELVRRQQISTITCTPGSEESSQVCGINFYCLCLVIVDGQGCKRQLAKGMRQWGRQGRVYGFYSEISIIRLYNSPAWLVNQSFITMDKNALSMRYYYIYCIDSGCFFKLTKNKLIK